MHDSDAFAALVAHVGEFYVTEKKMKSAQARIEALLAAGEADDRERADYVTAVRAYFTGFEKEARAHLRSVDKRLEHVNQVHFNLSAERGVAVRRIEATRQVLADAESVDS
ncbi:MAG TPA: hypothetical protein VIG51_02390 [Candidatus Baltobacteraceae bacterium]|jgi:hypothetical protein